MIQQAVRGCPLGLIVLMGNGHITKKRSQNAPSWATSYCSQSLNPNPEVPARDCEWQELVSGAPRPGSCHGPLACMLTELISDQGGWEEDRDVGAGGWSVH